MRNRRVAALLIGLASISIPQCPTFSPFTVTCVHEDFTASELEEFEQLGRPVLDAVAANDVDELIGLAVPMAQTNSGREMFQTAIDAVHQFGGDLDTARLVGTYLITTSGAQGNVPALCGDFGEPSQRIINVVKPSNRVLVLEFNTDDSLYVRSITMRFHDDDGQFMLGAIYSTTVQVHGRTAEDYQSAGETQLAQGDTVPAYFLLGMANLLSRPAPYISTETTKRAMSSLQQIDTDPNFPDAKTKWDFDGQELVAHNLGLQFIGDAILIEVQRIGDPKADKNTLNTESAPFAQYLIEQFPVLKDYFDGVTVSTYEKPPVSPQVQYQVYRHIVRMDEL